LKKRSINYCINGMPASAPTRIICNSLHSFTQTTPYRFHLNEPYIIKLWRHSREFQILSQWFSILQVPGNKAQRRKFGLHTDEVIEKSEWHNEELHKKKSSQYFKINPQTIPQAGHTARFGLQ
jgi:hypothetical protein